MVNDKVGWALTARNTRALLERAFNGKGALSTGINYPKSGPIIESLILTKAVPSRVITKTEVVLARTGSRRQTGRNDPAAVRLAWNRPQR